MGYFVKNRQLQSGSSGVVLPTGGTATRPDDPAFGLIRYNTDTGYIEYFDGTLFQSLAATGGVTYTVDSFTGDGSTVTFGPLSSTISAASDIIVFVGSIYQQPTTTYSITGGGNNITFTSAPPNGLPINAILTNS